MAVKCSKGYKYQDGKCVRYLTKIKTGTIPDSNKNVRRLILGLLILLAFLFAVNLRNPDVLWALGINLVLLGISYLDYQSPESHDGHIGIDKFLSSKTFAMIGYGIIFTIAFYLITLLIPGFSLGFPSLPGDISGSFKWFIINIISPLTESIFFLGTVLAFFRRITPNNKWIALTLASLVFASFHLGAYILGFYHYPDFTTALSSVWANISAFFVAFLFNMVAGAFLLKKGVRNLIFAIVFHFGLNFIAYSLSVVTFVVALPLLINHVLPLLASLI